MTFPVPEYHQHEEFINRSTKLKEIRDMGMEPYPHTFTPSHFAEDLNNTYHEKEVGHSEDAAAGVTPEVCVAGRLMLFRSMGKNAFAHLQDHTGRIQLMINRDLTKVEGFNENPELSHIKFIEKKIDLGDIIGIKGNLFRTQKGELTIFVKSLTLLCKTLLPLPDKHSGLADKGLRYRKRWLDLITNPEVVKQFKLRSKIMKQVRNYFENHGFIEVETPVLQNIYGGAEARPFVTELNALNQEMFLRISLEIPLKKLIVGGLDRIFEIGKVFRNEGIDRTHNPEFTPIEVYGAYMDYNDMMVLTENLFQDVALELFGKTEFPVTRDGEQEPVMIDVKAPWKRLTMKESIALYGKINVDALSDAELRKIMLDVPGSDKEKILKECRGKLIAMIFEEFVEKHLIQPHHITDHPIETTPLCKLHRDPQGRSHGLVERFESFILAHEFCNSYSELNDPELQRKLLVDQGQKKLAGDEEAHPLDEEFIESICQGMPPTGGLGIGLDRMIMLFVNAHSIRDVLYFPLMRLEEKS